jgi:hypothetical protein
MLIYGEAGTRRWRKCVRPPLFLCNSFGLVTALLAVPPGLADWAEIKKEKPAWKMGLYHMALCEPAK